MRRRFAVSVKGATLAQLLQYAGALKLNSRAVTLDVEEIGQLQLPCILHWDLNHFVVLKRVRRDTITILDPAVGERTLRMTEIGPHFTGVALELSPAADFERVDERPKLKLASLTGKVVGLKRSLAQIFAVAAVLELFAIASPLFNQLVVDDALTSGDHDLLGILALGFALLCSWSRKRPLALRAAGWSWCWGKP